MKKILKYALFCLSAVMMVSCDDYLDITPVGKVIPETLDDYRGVLTRGYQSFPSHKSLTAVRTDELLLNDYNDNFVFYKDIYVWNDVNPDRITNSFPYAALYNTIFYANVVINDAAAKLEDSEEKNQLLGEAYALRAYAYFDLLNLFAKPYNNATAGSDKGVPLALKIDLEQAFVPETVARIYDQIHSDKEEAKKLLSIDVQSAGLNYRFSKAALYALETRIYLYQNNWEKALQTAEKALTFNNELIDLNSAAVLTTSYDGAESILALEDVFTNNLKGTSYAAPALTNVFDKTNDLRFAVYFKPSGSRYTFLKGGELAQKCSFRSSELYLTKAEAAAQLNKLDLAKSTVLDFIVKRYNTTGYELLASQIRTMNQQALLEFIALERQREFTAEGHRWFDLRRTTQQEIIHTVDGEVYTLIQNDPRYTLPFPREAKLNNPNL
jgi:hypothetical protein